MVLEADHGRAVLLDYRDRADADPAALLVTDLDEPLTHATRFEHWDDLLVRLRFQRSGWTMWPSHTQPNYPTPQHNSRLLLRGGQLMRVNRQRAGRVVTVVAPPLVTVALLAVLGVVLDWPVWFAILVGVAMAVLGGYLLAASRAALRLDGNERATWLGRGEAAAFLTVAMAAVVSAATMYWQWTVPDGRHAEEMRGAADAAYTIAGLLTSMTPEGRDEYLRKLRPLVTDDVAQALRDKVLVPMPASRPPRKASSGQSASKSPTTAQRLPLPSSNRHLRRRRKGSVTNPAISSCGYCWHDLKTDGCSPIWRRSACARIIPADRYRRKTLDGRRTDESGCDTRTPAVRIDFVDRSR
jgi:hypothetical protein